MAGVKDSALTRLLGWPQGLDNLSAEEQVPDSQRRRDGVVVGALRVAQNIDLDDTGKPSTRTGFSLVSDYSNLHSLYASEVFPFMLAVHDGDLVMFDRYMARTVLVALTADTPMSYDHHGGFVYYTNGFDSGRVSHFGDRTAWALAPPLSAPEAAEYVPAGGLYAGTYQIACTFVAADGRESGSSPAVQVSIADGSGIQLSSLPVAQDPDVEYIRVYATGANGSVMRAVRDISAVATTFLIGVHQPGVQLETEFLEALPSGSITRFHNGRQFVARDRVLFWSEPLLPGLGKLQANYLMFNAPITMVEGFGEGPSAVLYIAAGARTYLMAGDDVSTWVRRIVHPHGAVPGSSVKVDMTALGLEGSGRVPYWLDDSGQFVLGTASGVVMLHHERYVAEVGVERAATVLRESGGSRHVISVLKGGTASGFGMTDSAEAEVWRNGVRIA